MLRCTLPLIFWFFNLFDPPPLQSMNWAQKIARVALVTVSLLITCILMAMLSSLVIFIVQRGLHMLRSGSEFMGGLVIIFVGITVNIVCVMILVEMSKADGRLMTPPRRE